MLVRTGTSDSRRVHRRRRRRRRAFRLWLCGLGRGQEEEAQEGEEEEEEEKGCVLFLSVPFFLCFFLSSPWSVRACGVVRGGRSDWGIGKGEALGFEGGSRLLPLPSLPSSSAFGRSLRPAGDPTQRIFLSQGRRPFDKPLPSSSTPSPPSLNLSQLIRSDPRKTAFSFDQAAASLLY